jgi:hypothetical protein
LHGKKKLLQIVDAQFVGIHKSTKTKQEDFSFKKEMIFSTSVTIVISAAIYTIF